MSGRTTQAAVVTALLAVPLLTTPGATTTSRNCLNYVLPGRPAEESLAWARREAFAKADAIFSGTVTSVETARQSHPPELARLGCCTVERARFRPLKVWKGDLTAEVVVWAGIGGSHDYRFTRGRDYLVYAHAGPEGLGTNDCTRTIPLDKAADEIAVLDTFKKPK